MSFSEILGENKTIDIIFSLSKGPKHIRLLQREIGGSTTTIESRVKNLICAGLIQEAKGSTPGRRILELTEQGRSAVIILKWLPKPANHPTSPLKSDFKGPEKWIMVLLYTLNQIKGSTRLEKLLFLLKEEFKIVSHPFYNFVPYIFGPYSSEVLNDVKMLQELGLIEIRQEAFESSQLNDWLLIRKTYKLTEKGRSIAKKIYERLPNKARLTSVLWKLKELNSMPLNRLLQHVYQNYPEYAYEDVIV